ncbi:MAG: leucyl aminopeptidase family protein [Mycoplasma sp.]|nr:leucyl aminopeptidase family protein [Candidatus Hennigella equi]
MEFNKPINKKALLIKATAGTKNEIKTEGNTITFVFAKAPMCTRLFTRQLSNVLLKNKDKDITFNIGSFLDHYKVDCGYSLATTILIKLEAFCGKMFSLKSKPIKNKINVIYSEKYKNLVYSAYTTSFGFSLARHYQGLPTNYLGIADFVKEIKKVIPATGNKALKVKILTLADLKKEKMGLIQAVNKGSDEPAAMVVLEYLNNKASKDVLAYVGKGMMYDAGGYEIKPNRFMENMNQDMTGAASVFGTMFALASMKQKVNVVGLLPLAKNMISDRSMVVGDVYTSITGRTVEVTSPDSEGRMILADAIGYANKHYKITKLFTIATLTGLSEIAFGDLATPFWSTNEATAKAVEKAAELSGDGVVSLRLYPEYTELVNKSSNIADCANGAKERNCSNGQAAAFLKEFCACKDFTHFDIAGTHIYKKHTVNPLGFMMYLFAVNHFKK